MRAPFGHYIFVAHVRNNINLGLHSMQTHKLSFIPLNIFPFLFVFVSLIGFMLPLWISTFSFPFDEYCRCPNITNTFVTPYPLSSFDPQLIVVCVILYFPPGFTACYDLVFLNAQDHYIHICISLCSFSIPYRPC